MGFLLHSMLMMRKATEKSIQGLDTWASNLTKEVLSWTHKREMVSSDVIKQGQWRAIYFWNRMESVTGLLMVSWLKAEGVGILDWKTNSVLSRASGCEYHYKSTINFAINCIRFWMSAEMQTVNFRTSLTILDTTQFCYRSDWSEVFSTINVEALFPFALN